MLCPPPLRSYLSFKKQYRKYYKKDMVLQEQSLKLYSTYKKYTRKDLVMQGINKEQRGLEFGPMHSPFAPKKEGYCVETVDCMSQEELREHYKNQDVNLEAIEPVDYIWKGGSYCSLIGKENYYDYIIASHMIEHTTNFCGFLSDCSKLMKENGVLKLVIPDKRYCFDHYRNVTGLAEILNNAFSPSDIQSVGCVADYYMNVVFQKGSIVWKRYFYTVVDNMLNYGIDQFAFVHKPDKALDRINRVAQQKEYIDIHHYVFTPASFQLLLYDLRLLGMTDLKVIQIQHTGANNSDFLAVLKKTDEKPEWDPQYRKLFLKLVSKQNLS